MNSLRVMFAGTILLILASAGTVRGDERLHLAQAEAAASSPEPERTQEAQPGPEEAAESAPPEASEANPYVAPRFEQKIDLEAIELEPFYEKLAAKAARDEMPLTLEECIRRALESNLTIQIVSFSPLKSAADIMAARGEFDPIGSGSLTYTEAQQQASSQVYVFGGISQIEDYLTSGKAGISGKLQWGTQYDVSLMVETEESTFNYFIKEWSGGLTLSLTQPLLRGRGKAVNLARVRIAQNAEESAENQLKLQTMSSVAEVVKAYWDLVGAIEQLKVRQSSMANAERLLTLNEKRLEIGVGAAIDVVQARAGLAARQSDVISAMGTVGDATNRLRNLLNVQQGEPLQERRIVPVDRPRPDDSEVNIDESLGRALEMRPEVRSAELAIESARINKTVARNSLLPQLDIGGSVSQGGRGPDKNDVFDGIKDRTDNSYTINIQGSVPIGNRTARGQYQRSRIEVSEAERQLDKARQDIMLAVRTAYITIETNRTLVESSKQSRKLQEVNVSAEEKRLELGLTSSYQVLDMQDDLTAAQSQEVQATIALEKAFVDLRLAEGSLLNMLGIEFVAPEPEPTIGFVRSVVPFIDKE
ncbi:MAG TPA: TolC family protein [Candidatus Hydrogenedentes bacterium]|nr:TolC family protein [Candidatus Hydrogenedentota bacterium]HQM51212.1 TolC family protein [Candidatus Hydrogenedentota bacterium]